ACPNSQPFFVQSLRQRKLRETFVATDHRLSAAPSTAASPAPLPAGAPTTLWILWLTYGSFYFGRTNISAAVPGLMAPVAAGGLGLLSTRVGAILAAFKIAYGIGQLLNGQLAEQI